MFGKDKLMIRKKAMESMMREGPSVEMKKRPMEPEMASEEDGFISFMVTPEEKEMILEMRQGSEEEESEPVEPMNKMSGMVKKEY